MTENQAVGVGVKREGWAGEMPSSEVARVGEEGICMIEGSRASRGEEESFQDETRQESRSLVIGGS